MDLLLHRKYKNLEFPEEIEELFADIVANDNWLGSVLFYIVSEVSKKETNSEAIIGISITEVSNDLIIPKKVKHIEKNKVTFEKEHASMDRKHAERVIQCLMKMSLLYYVVPSGRTHFYLPTERGIQVLQRSIEIANNKDEVNQ